MANRYYFSVPYSCTTYGRVKGCVIADDMDEAVDKINNRDFEDEEYDDTDSGNYDLDCSEGDITVDQYDIYGDENNEEEECGVNDTDVPSYYLAEVLNI